MKLGVQVLLGLVPFGRIVGDHRGGGHLFASAS